MGKFVVGSSGRVREVARIRQANRACAAGRLLLGEIRSWQEFLEADTLDLASLTRRRLKAGSRHVGRFLAGEIARFCRQNFEGMTEAKLADLFEAVKALAASSCRWRSSRPGSAGCRRGGVGAFPVMQRSASRCGGSSSSSPRAS
jgi:hypothetical protein